MGLFLDKYKIKDEEEEEFSFLKNINLLLQ